MKKIIYIVIFFLISFELIGQNEVGLPIIKNYYPIDFHAHFQTWDGLQDDDGIMFFANSDGVLTFDGTYWDLLELSNEQTVRTIKKSKSGKIYLAGDNVLGYLSVDSTNNLKFVSLFDSIPEKYQDFTSLWDMKIENNYVYVQSSKYLFVINEKNNSIKVHISEKNFFNLFVSSKNQVFVSGIGFYSILKNDQLETNNIGENIINFFERKDTVFCVTSNNNIYYFDKNQNNIFYKHFDFDFSGISFSRTVLFQDKYLLYTTYNKGLIMIDFDGNLIFRINKESGLIGDNIYNVFFDNIGNIWILTSNGISYIEFASPIRVLDSRYDFDISHPIFLSYFNNKIFTCTGHMLYQIEIKNNSKPIFTNIPEGSGQTWDAINIGDEIYLSHNTQILRIDKEGNTKKYGPSQNVWTIKKIPNSKNDYIVGCSKGIFHYKYDGDSLRFQKKIENFNQNVRELYFDKDNYLWTSQNDDGVYKLKLSDTLSIESSEFYGIKKGLTNSNSTEFFEFENNLFISTYKTLFIYDYDLDTIHEFHPITDLFDIKDKTILQLIGIDSIGNFWFEYYDENYNSEIFCYKKEGDKFIETNKFAKQLINHSLSFISQYNKNTVIAGNSRNYAFLNLDNPSSCEHSFNTFVRKIYTTNDSLLYGGNILDKNGRIIRENTNKNKLIIEYKDNDLRFLFAANCFSEPDKTRYRVKLVNYDNDWSLWSYETKKDYTNLPPGNYEFLVEAKNIFDQTSKIASFKLYVKYPWYRTIYAYIFYFLLLLLLLFGVVKLFTYRIKRKNEKLEELVNERTQQIQQNNAELEQQKEEILTQAEELLIVNQELEKFSIIIRETDNAVILADKDGNFVWVNPAFTKIFGYTFEELINDVSSNLIADRTEPHIKKIVNRCLTKKVTVEYELKLKNRFGKDIWIHTTLTPLIDDEGNIVSLVAIDSDITNQKNAEKRIIEQKDQITSSIKYALKIQESILPSKQEIGILFDNFIIYEPKDIVSGDFYWVSNVFRTENNKFRRVPNVENGLKVGHTVYFAAVDCTGHGVPGAFMSLIGSRLLGEIVNEQRISKPKDILYHLDFKLSRVLKRSQKRNYDGMVVSICRFDKMLENKQEVLKVTFAGAKQHISYYSQKTKKFTKLRGSARQIGFVVNENLEFFDKEFTLTNGDSLFLYSDGLKDLNNPQRESFGHTQIINILRENINKPIEDIGVELKKKMNEWLKDEHQRDDITFIGLKIK